MYKICIHDIKLIYNSLEIKDLTKMIKRLEISQLSSFERD